MIPEQYGRYDEITMIPYLVKEQGFKLIIYGIEDCGKYIFDWMKLSYDIKAECFLDTSEGGKEKYICDTKVLTPEELLKTGMEKCIVVISQMSYRKSDDEKKVIDKIMNMLKDNILKCMVCYGGNLCNGVKVDWYYYIKNNTNSFEKIYEMFNDELSKETLIEYLKTYICGSRYAGKTMPEEYKYWGDVCNRFLIRLTNEEVFLNIGACRGDAIYQYLKCKGSYKKIIAVEGDERAFGFLKRNISFLDEHIRRAIQCDNYMLGEEYTIDNLYGNENIALINMDIEGAELQVLKSGEQTIKNKRPALAICVYHKKEDLIDITTYIKQLVNEYIFVLRKYPSSLPLNNIGFDGIQQSNELVLYAIPRERFGDKMAINKRKL